MAFLTADEVVTQLFDGKVSRGLVYKLFRSGALRGTRAGSRVLIDPASVREYIDRQAAQQTPQKGKPDKPARPSTPAGSSTWRHFRLPDQAVQPENR